jgi:hypothetical protein
LRPSRRSGARPLDFRFAPGARSTTINDTIRGREYVDYLVTASGARTMVVSLALTATNGEGSARFDILTAGENEDDLRSSAHGAHRARHYSWGPTP